MRDSAWKYITVTMAALMVVPAVIAMCGILVLLSIAVWRDVLGHF